MTTAGREGRDRGEPDERSSGWISPVVGDIERTTTATAAGGTESPVMQALRSLTYPLVRDDLECAAEGRGAPAELLDLLARLPNWTYISAEDVTGEL
jgi:hypothetical protein